MLFLSQCAAGQREPALALLDERAAGLPRAGRLNTIGSWSALFKVIEDWPSSTSRGAWPNTTHSWWKRWPNETAVTFDGGRLIETLAGLTAASWRPMGRRGEALSRTPFAWPARCRSSSSRLKSATGTQRMLLDRGTPAARRQCEEHLETALSNLSNDRACPGTSSVARSCAREPST
jgi:hypothetical protein